MKHPYAQFTKTGTSFEHLDRRLCQENKVENSEIDVVENNQELIDYIDFLESPINIIKGDALSYTPDKKYDLILIDLWCDEDNITQEIQDNIKNNYNSHLESGGKIVLPILEKEL